MKNKDRNEKEDRIKFHIGNTVRTGVIKKIHPNGIEVEEDETGKLYFIDYRKIIEKL